MSTLFFRLGMRIAMVGQKGIPAHFGGIERHVDELSRELVRRGHEVLVFVRSWYTPEAMTAYEGVELVHTKSWHTKNFDAITHTFISLWKAMHCRPDVIHIHGVGPALMAWIPRVFAPRTKVVVTFHCIDRNQRKWGWFARLMLHIGEWAACKFPHHTIVISHVLEEYCWKHYRTRTIYITNGVVPTCYAPGPMHATWQLMPYRYLLMLSRLVPHKGAHYLIQAWRKLQEENPKLVAPYRLVIAGGSHFTEEYLAQLANLAANDPSIVFTGWVKGTEVGELVSNCALFVHPSDIEGLPIGVLEAMACERPVLVSDIPEHREVLPDERFWFKQGNVDDLARQIIVLLSDRELLRQAADIGKERVQKEYNWKKIAAEIEELYAA